jgi:hypothetical protein
MCYRAAAPTRPKFVRSNSPEVGLLRRATSPGIGGRLYLLALAAIAVIGVVLVFIVGLIHVWPYALGITAILVIRALGPRCKIMTAMGQSDPDKSAPRSRRVEEVRFARDSALEGAGFELPVPI